MGSTPERTEPQPALDALATAVVDAAFHVHRSLGPGFVEAVYEEALCVELKLRNLSFNRQTAVCVRYKGFVVGEGRLDLLADGRLVVELKAVEKLAPVHVAQVVSYLRFTRCHLGLLINFQVRQLRHGIRRIVLSDGPSG